MPEKVVRRVRSYWRQDGPPGRYGDPLPVYHTETLEDEEDPGIEVNQQVGADLPQFPPQPQPLQFNVSASGDRSDVAITIVALMITLFLAAVFVLARPLTAQQPLYQQQEFSQ
jgi:hypothetical protein